MVPSIKYPGLRAEMARRQLTIKDMADGISTHRDTLSRWLSGARALPLPKAQEIRDKYFPRMTLDELFSIQ